MKPRARRITIGAAAVAVALLAVLVVAKWGTVRDHVEAWRFQLTRETETIQPVTGVTDPLQKHLLHVAARQLGYPVIYDPGEIADGEVLWLRSDEPDMKAFLWTGGFRLLEQRFPRKAYVLVRAYDPLQGFLLGGTERP